MKKTVIPILMGVCFFSLALQTCSQSREDPEVKLWPRIEPFQSDYLKVSGIHEMYYELSGNPQGKPVFVLHGGPGGSISPYYRRFFNPEKFLIVLYDQRGCGKSRPYGEIRENTTPNLVEDIEILRKHLKLDKIILFGGSWGSTLGLAYGETYPKNVAGMVLRGIFTATQEEIDHFYHGGVRAFFPEIYEALIKEIPEKDRNAIPKALLQKVQTDDKAVKDKYSLLWTKYEYTLAMLETPKDLLDQLGKGDISQYYAFAVFENYYMANGCFLEEGQLLRDSYMIKDIPITLVNGRYDMICPPINAYRLHQRLPQSKLVIAEGAGHWMGDPPVQKAMLQAMMEFE